MKILQNPERMRSECRLPKARIQTDNQQYTIILWLTAVRNMLYLVSSAKETHCYILMTKQNKVYLWQIRQCRQQWKGNVFFLSFATMFKRTHHNVTLPANKWMSRFALVFEFSTISNSVWHNFICQSSIIFGKQCVFLELYAK